MIYFQRKRSQSHCHLRRCLTKRILNNVSLELCFDSLEFYSEGHGRQCTYINFWFVKKKSIVTILFCCITSRSNNLWRLLPVCGNVIRKQDDSFEIYIIYISYFLLDPISLFRSSTKGFSRPGIRTSVLPEGEFDHKDRGSFFTGRCINSHVNPRYWT